MSFVTRIVAILIILALSIPAHADAYDDNPRLVVILVFDQFRGDYLDRYRAGFKAKNGWNLFLKQGAHFTDCYYDYANLVTAAGHATIGTGAYTDGHQVPLNEWYEPGPDGVMHSISSVDDPRYKLVGAPEGTKNLIGASPYREMATTLGDELVLATGGRSRVYGVSLKDRAAILTSGHASKGAFWVDHDSGQWQTSTYWMNQLPEWATKFNASGRAAQARKESGVATGSFYEKVGQSVASVTYQLDFAKTLIDAEKLGRNPAGTPDLITISISSTDINGHALGPDDPSQKALIVQSDAALDSFFTWLDTTVGLKNVMVAMTGDHGVAVTQQAGDAVGMPVSAFSASVFTTPLESMLEAKYPLKGKGEYLLQMDNPYLFLNPPAFEAAGVSEEEAENTTKAMLEKVFSDIKAADRASGPGHRSEPPALTHVFTTIQMRDGLLPDTQYGRLVAHSYSPNIGWALHLNFGPYQFPGHDTGTTHFSANSYDRHVPLDLFGTAIIPGTYHGMVAPVDIAATFASLLRVNRPSAAVGRVLTEAIRPEPAGPAPRKP
ncbi:alkaline phosphatase family protein [Granulicella sibirica]|uniref:Alkaline phosphatase n=1 Tax=Granulicella sibirica TaxID=2479048 RepID=A0A4Q0T3W4_9BACT|nr:alkaline phosphatase family protein [Granulicella sibirica]RXH57602.1 Alkaline phosphatase [Granulicella sibirica]